MEQVRQRAPWMRSLLLLLLILNGFEDTEANGKNNIPLYEQELTQIEVVLNSSMAFVAFACFAQTFCLGIARFGSESVFYKLFLLFIQVCMNKGFGKALSRVYRATKLYLSALCR